MNIHVNKFGWLAPSGKFLECNFHEHLEIAKNNEEIQKIPQIMKLLKELEEQHKSCEDLSERDGFSSGEWHNYDILLDEIRPQIIKHLYRVKFIRVGEFKNTFHFEGFPNVLKSRYQECKNLAEQYDMTCQFEPVK